MNNIRIKIRIPRLYLQDRIRYEILQSTRNRPIYPFLFRRKFIPKLDPIPEEREM